jgi:ParB family chromosome partitioning protein
MVYPARIRRAGAPAHGKQVCWLEMERIAPNPNQPRKTFDQAALRELAESIRQCGLLQPISVRALDAEGYELISGARRMAACRMLGMTHIDAIVLPASPQDSALLALIENLQREDLHYFEEAEGYAAVLRRFSLSQEELAARIGRNQSTVANKLRLLRLNPAVRAVQRGHGQTERHARALLRLPDEQDRLRVAEQAAAKSLSVQQTEALVALTLEKLRQRDQPHRRVISLMRDHRVYINAIRDIIQQMKASGITADYSLQDLGDRIEMRVVMPRKLS